MALHGRYPGQFIPTNTPTVQSYGGFWDRAGQLVPTGFDDLCDDLQVRATANVDAWLADRLCQRVAATLARPAVAAVRADAGLAPAMAS